MVENHDKRAIKKCEEKFKGNTQRFGFLVFSFLFFFQSEVPKSKDNPRVFAAPAPKPLSLHRGEEDVREEREEALAWVKRVHFKGCSELAPWLPGHSGTKCSFHSVSVSAFPKW